MKLEDGSLLGHANLVSKRSSWTVVTMEQIMKQGNVLGTILIACEEQAIIAILAIHGKKRLEYRIGLTTIITILAPISSLKCCYLLTAFSPQNTPTFLLRSKPGHLISHLVCCPRLPRELYLHPLLPPQQIDLLHYISQCLVPSVPLLGHQFDH